MDCKYDPKLINTGNSGIEIVGIQVHVPHEVNVFCVYRPLTYNKKQFMEKLCNVLNDHCNVPTCIVGDFNENILDNVEKNIHKTFTDTGFHQHVNTPTRDSGSLLDHVYTHNIRDVNVDVHDCYYSDHDIMYCCFKILSPTITFSQFSSPWVSSQGMQVSSTGGDSSCSWVFVCALGHNLGKKCRRHLQLPTLGRLEQ